MKTKTAESAGGVIFTDDGKVVITARLSFKGQLQYGFPKGTVEAGETLEQAAMREATEETGLKVEIVDRLHTIDYWFVQPARQGEEPMRIHKFVHYYSMRMTGGDPGAHDNETEEVLMVEASKARELITFPTERKLLDEAERTRA